jgi:hypothetical protein
MMISEEKEEEGKYDESTWVGVFIHFVHEDLTDPFSCAAILQK